MSNQYTAIELKETLLDQGYREVYIFNEDLVVVKAYGRTYLLGLYPDGDIQILYMLKENSPFSLSKINELNSDYRNASFFTGKDDENTLIVQFTITGLGEKLTPRKVVEGLERADAILRSVDFDDLLD
ncbi:MULTISPECIES: hypothetical protein [Avibacterium]|uniref:YbjN domain-containing protein n=2 Tax=Avibacterium TaxID=292486 RepID=A0A379ARV0_AVIAV|nr:MULTISPECIES: hypothetical protein [Avibacterium]SUB24426.1 Uncharacterised protein [Avibacterium avium]